MRSIRPFVREPFAQFAEARGAKAGALDPLAGAPAYDFLTGTGGFLQVFTHGLTGLRMREDRVQLDPTLPPQLQDGVTLTRAALAGPDVRRRRSARRDHGDADRRRAVHGRDAQGRDGERGRPGAVPTRRPDLAPTDNAARCRRRRRARRSPACTPRRPSTAAARRSGRPTGARGHAHRRPRPGRAYRPSPCTGPTPSRPPRGSRPRWTARTGPRPRPPAPTAASPQPVSARYVRVEFTRGPTAERTGLRELEVIRSA